MPSEVFSIFWLLKKEGVEGCEDKANEMRNVLEKFPYFRRSEGHEREVKQKLCGLLLQSGIKDAHKIAELAQYAMRVIKGGAR